MSVTTITFYCFVQVIAKQTERQCLTIYHAKQLKMTQHRYNLAMTYTEHFPNKERHIRTGTCSSPF